VGVDHTAEGDSITLPSYRLDEKVIVLAEKYSTQFIGPVQEVGIR
jgi:hypothetical protein